MFLTSGMDYTAPEAPSGALELMPAESESFASDLLKILSDAFSAAEPELSSSLQLCLAILAAAILLSVLKSISEKFTVCADLVGVLSVSSMLLSPAGSAITLAADTLTQLSEYAKLLLPVMTAALASEGGLTASGGLYTATALFDAVLSNVVSTVLVPLVSVYLLLSVCAAASAHKVFDAMAETVRWANVWLLKLILYIFTGYIALTGVISGTADAATVRAARLTLSGMIPVVGGILSDASEAVVVGAGLMKNAAGIYGILALICICIVPFLRIGITYIAMKITATFCAVFDVASVQNLMRGFTNAMGLLLAMTGCVCIFYLISIVCFLKGLQL